MSDLHTPQAESHDHEDLGELPKAPEPSRKALLGIGGLLVAALAAAFVFGLVPKIRRSSALENETIKATHRPMVQVTKPKLRPSSGELNLPGTVQPLQETTIYARTNGYVRRWLVDIGDQVHEGQLLADIDTPEVDAQLRGAQAALGEAKAAVEQAKTQLELSKVELKRVQQLATTGFSSEQERDQKEAAFHVAEANLKAADAKVGSQEAEVARLSQLKSFAHVTAPFSGVITYRNTEVGSLVTAGTSTALFHLQKSNIVRVFVSVPQNQASQIRPGQETVVTIHNQPNQPFKGLVTRTAKALDNATHTLMTEVDIHNEDGALLPGMYVEVRFSKVTGEPQLTIPTTTVLYNAQGTLVALVDTNEKVHLQPVQLGEDYGTEIAVLSGLTGDDRVMLNPSDKAIEGLEVEVRAPESANAKTVSN